MPRPGESGVVRKPLLGVMGVWRRSWMSRGPVARPLARERSRAEARWIAAVSPTPVSREDVRTMSRPREWACSMMERAAVNPPTLASLMTRRSTAAESARAWAGLCTFGGLIGGDRHGGGSTEPGEGVGVGGRHGLFDEFRGVFCEVLDGKERPWSRAKPGWHRGGA